jgi:hypothetical protein
VSSDTLFSRLIWSENEYIWEHSVNSQIGVIPMLSSKAFIYSEGGMSKHCHKYTVYFEQQKTW